ncbi:MAG TPA: DUF4390 domain-containing protein [Gemmatimonadaceae bacterium]|nr:DUF4390 domain-containing protein [Gemmatimonadaceae bacterium]
MHARPLSFALAASALAAAAAAAQPSPRIRVEVPAAAARAAGGPTVIIENAFLDKRSEELLSAGFTASITTTVELWQDRGWFDAMLETDRWRRVLRYDALSKTYRAARVVGVDSLAEEGRFSTLDDVRAWIGQPHKGSIVPPGATRQLYYATTVTIETLNINDLVEVQSWLRGEVRPAIRGEKNPGSALVRTFRTILTKFFGGDTKRLQKTSERFNTN